MNYIKKLDVISLGNKLFLIGIFFLPSALPISILFLFSSIIISFSKDASILIKDKLNYPLLVSIGLIIFSTINLGFIKEPNLLSNYNLQIAWINLFNWIPAFFIYCGFQIYLMSHIQRVKFSKYLVSGCFPVLISFILQKYFNLFGPFETLNGLIVWFQRPVNYHRYSGLFSNANYAGIWLALVLPFSLFLLQKSESNFWRRSIIKILCISIAYAILLSASRNALIGIFITITVLYGLKRFFVLTSISISTFFAWGLINPLINGKKFLTSYIDQNILIDRLININFLDAPRLEIWRSALSRIKDRPLFGWGPSTFPILHDKYNDTLSNPVAAAHAHNMPLELAHNFGIPLALILISTLFLLLFRAIKSTYDENNLNENIILNKAWIASTLIIISSHLSDITYYDGKISILICTLFAGLKCIGNKSTNYK